MGVGVGAALGVGAAEGCAVAVTTGVTAAAGAFGLGLTLSAMSSTISATPSAAEIAIYAYLLFCEDRQTFQCWPSYRKIGDAVGLSPNTIRKHIRALKERGLLVTEPTMVTTKDGCKRNGNLLFTIRPIQAALQQDYDRQLQKLTEDAARRKYADFIENTG